MRPAPAEVGVPDAREAEREHVDAGGGPPAAGMRVRHGLRTRRPVPLGRRPDGDVGGHPDRERTTGRPRDRRRRLPDHARRGGRLRRLHVPVDGLGHGSADRAGRLRRPGGRGGRCPGPDRDQLLHRHADRAARRRAVRHGLRLRPAPQARLADRAPPAVGPALQPAVRGARVGPARHRDRPRARAGPARGRGRRVDRAAEPPRLGPVPATRGAAVPSLRRSRVRRGAGPRPPEDRRRTPRVTRPGTTTSSAPPPCWPGRSARATSWPGSAATSSASSQSARHPSRPASWWPAPSARWRRPGWRARSGTPVQRRHRLPRRLAGRGRGDVRTEAATAGRRRAARLGPGGPRSPDAGPGRPGRHRRV
jgi:hypothetical protein